MGDSIQQKSRAGCDAVSHYHGVTPEPLQFTVFLFCIGKKSLFSFTNFYIQENFFFESLLFLLKLVSNFISFYKAQDFIIIFI